MLTTAAVKPAVTERKGIHKLRNTFLLQVQVILSSNF